MVGGGIKKDDGLAAISSTNIFSALEKKRRKSNRKKLSDKDKALGKGKDSKGDKKEDEPEQFWAPSQGVTVKSWADCDDDEDYYATTAPPPAPWAPDQAPDEAASAVKDGGLSQGEESEGDDEGDEEIEDDVEEEQQENDSAPAVTTDAVKPGLPPLSVPREPERQLSKRELKKKELAELDAVLLELGLTPKEENGTPLPVVDEKTVVDDAVDQLEDGDPRNGPSLTESKSTKRRKAKKEKSFKEGRDGEVPLTTDVETGRAADEGVAEEEANGPPADPKEVLKKLASLKKKKSMKESDAAAKAAASEAAARAAKQAAAKKKEKNHYNQQPVR